MASDQLPGAEHSVAERLVAQPPGPSVIAAWHDAVFAHSPIAIVLTDDRGRTLEANPAACDMLGRSLDELKAMALEDLIRGPVTGTEWAAFLHQGHAAGEANLCRPDGNSRVARFRAAAHVQPGVHLFMLVDATVELQARQHERELATQMDLAMANADIVFWKVDLEADEVTSSNPNWLQQLLGYEPSTVPHGMQAWDAMVHPDDYNRREAAWQAHLLGESPVFEAEFRMRHQAGHWVWLRARGRAVARNAQGHATLVVGVRIDISQHKQAEQQLLTLAFTDELTGALNRRRFLELAAIEVERARRHNQPLSLLMIDLDHFKTINDVHGHAGGDAVLQAFVKIVQAWLRTGDLFGRVGGEEFAVLMPQTECDGAASLAQRLADMVQAHSVVLPRAQVSYSVSIGVSVRPTDAAASCSVESLMQAADGALYLAKAAGRNRVNLAA